MSDLPGDRYMHTSRPRALAITIATATLVASTLLAGCSGKDTPEAKDAPAPSISTPTATPTPSAEPTPDHKPETAREFLRRWPQVEHQMLVTGQAGAFREYTSLCTKCSQLADTIEGYYAAGGWVKTRTWRIKRLERVGGSADKPEFLVEKESPPTRYRESSSGPIKRLDGGASTRHVWLRRTGTGGWVIFDAVVVEG